MISPGLERVASLDSLLAAAQRAAAVSDTSPRWRPS